MSRLEDPLPKKGGRSVDVKAPIGGKILIWYFGDGDYVREDWYLCAIGTTAVPGGVSLKVPSPATGFLDILVGEKADVYPGMTIAKIKTSTLI